MHAEITVFLNQPIVPYDVDNLPRSPPVASLNDLGNKIAEMWKAWDMIESSPDLCLPGSLIFYVEHVRGSKLESAARLYRVISIPRSCQGKTEDI
jgi:hypothetical protein